MKRFSFVLIGTIGVALSAAAPRSAFGSAERCGLALALEQAVDAVHVPAVSVDEDTVFRTFVRLRERSEPSAIAWLRLQAWRKAFAYRATLADPASALARRLEPYRLDGPDGAILFLLTLSEYELAAFVLGDAADATAYEDHAALLTQPIDAATFFPSTDRSGLASDAAFRRYEKLFDVLETRFGLRSPSTARRFEASAREQARRAPIPLGGALSRFLRAEGVEL
jgi:hypothetical protein